MRKPHKELPGAENPHGRLYGGGMLAIFAAMVIATSTAAGAGEAFLLPASNVLWRTAPSADFEVPISMPHGASSATLVVEGYKYRQEYTGLADGMFQLSLPSANSDRDENVYDLTLTFNDAAATTRKARIAVVQGASTGSAAAANVRVDGSRSWSNVCAKAVLPIPADVDEVSIDGQTVSADLWQSPGWFLFSAPSDSTHDIALADGGNPLAAASLYGVPTGFRLIFQ